MRFQRLTGALPGLLLLAAAGWIPAAAAHGEGAPKICFDSCQSCLGRLTFDDMLWNQTGLSRTCHSRRYLESLYLCLGVYCMPEARAVGLGPLNQTCQDVAHAPIPPFDIISNYTKGHLDSLRQVDLNDTQKAGVWREVVLPSKSLFGAWWDTLDSVDYTYYRHYSYSVALIVFWVIVVVIGLGNHLITALFHSQVFRSPSLKSWHSLASSHSWLVNRISVPATFGNRCAQQIGWGTVPPRIQSLTITAFILLNIIYCVIGYKLVPVNLYFRGTFRQILRYSSDRTGVISFANFPLIWMFGMRNNILMWMTGWDFGTYNNFHRWVARIATVEAIYHSLGYTVLILEEGGLTYFTYWWTQLFWCTGVVATVFMSLLLGFSIYWLRRQHKNLDRALTLVRKCKRSGVLRRVVTITTTSAADFRKLFTLLDASIGDVRWLLSIFDSADGTNLSLPPIASNDPILSWVWSAIAAVQMGELPDMIEGASQLASLALDNDRNKKIIVEEGGVPPLLKLLKEVSTPDAQVAAATALLKLASDQERVRLIATELGIPIIVQVFYDSPTRVQILVANLVSRMAEHDPFAQEEFARENAIRPLVSLLSLDIFMDDPKPQSGKPSLHSLVQINKELGANSTVRPSHQPNSYLNSTSSLHSFGQHRRDWEAEKPEVKRRLKISCAEALWMLARDCVLNSRRITETKGLMCLAKIIEKEQGELQLNCLMTVMEITAAAESDADLRRAAFKTNSPAAKAVVDQLLKVIAEKRSPSLEIPAIKSIGSLARTFPARETRVISPLVTQLSNANLDLAVEAAIALGKFVCPENYLCVEHSKSIIEFTGISPVLRLLRGNDRAQVHGLILLCYLALHVGDSQTLEQERLLTVLEGARDVAAHNPVLRELVPMAIYHLEIYHAGLHPHKQSYAP